MNATTRTVNTITEGNAVIRVIESPLMADELVSGMIQLGWVIDCVVATDTVLMRLPRIAGVRYATVRRIR